MSRLRVGIAGYGIVGKRRRQCIDQHPSMKTVAICDRYFSDQGVMSDGVHYYRHYMQLLKEDLDVLFVCLTNDIAPEVTIAGIESGLHVFYRTPGQGG